MIEIDGSVGGGQLVRSALSCSMIRGEGFTIADVRGARPSPGLKPQHVSAIEAAAALCDATVTGAHEGSSALTFEPGPLRPRDLSIDIGSAGSVSLLFDTVFPIATELDRPIAITATGGTDVKWSPPIDYLRYVKLPLLRRFNLHAVIDLDRRGFYPVGGGRVRFTLLPSTPDRIELTERGEVSSVSIHSVASWDLERNDVAERQAEAALETIETTDLPVRERSITYTRTPSTGSVMVIRAASGGTTAGFNALGERGKRAETVGNEAAEALIAFAGESAPVDAHLADQLTVPLALAGGRIEVPTVTDHIRTNLDLLDTFGYSVSVARSNGTATLRSP